jgi:hypothetical protein
MPYDYATERASIFTESGQAMFLEIRDNAKRLLSEAGAFRFQELTRSVAGDSWAMLACVDRLVELRELREVTTGQSVAGQHRIFTTL